MRLIFIIWLLTISIALSVFPAISSAETFQVDSVLSDGKDGRVWRQWREHLQEKGVQSVLVVLRKQSGGSDTFVNLRYGSNSAFENGKQVFLTNNIEQTVSWSVKGESPRGQPLVLNAYKGEVFVSQVIVQYVGDPAVKSPIPMSKPSESGPTAHTQASAVRNEAAVLQQCKKMRVKAPRIELGQIKPQGGPFSGKHKAEGSVYGACIEEAGYYENGRMKQKIDFPLSERYQRKEFSFDVHTGKNGEIRVFTVSGREDVIYVDEEIANQRSVFR